jgi:WD40 repeat protein
MSRVTLAVCAALLAVAPARAAEPQPLWEVRAAVPEKRAREVNWVGFSPDGKTLVAHVAFQRGASRLFAWDAQTRKEKFALELDSREYAAEPADPVAMTGDDTVLVAGAVAREVSLADGKAADVRGVPGDTLTVWFDPASRRTLWHGEKGLADPTLTAGQLSVLDGNGPRAAAKWQTSRLRGVPAEIRTVAVNPDATRVVVAGDLNDGSPRRTLTLSAIVPGDKLTLTEVARVPSPHQDRFASIRFSPDGKTLAVGSGDCSVSLWDVEKAGKDWKPRETVATGRWTASCLAFSPDGRTLAVGTYDQKAANLFLIDVRGGKLVSSRTVGGQLTAVAYSPDGKHLVTGDGDGRLRVWDAAAVRGD